MKFQINTTYLRGNDSKDREKMIREYPYLDGRLDENGMMSINTLEDILDLNTGVNTEEASVCGLILQIHPYVKGSKPCIEIYDDYRE